MDIEKMKEALHMFIEVMNANDLTEIELEDEELRIRVKKGSEVHSSPMPFVTQVEASPGPTAGTGPESAASPEAEGDLVEIPSPLVGTFYRAPSPEAVPFVEIGDEVDTDTVLCIVEAMKVMNEIKSETAGSIVEILVDNGHAVEYGQPLFLIRPL